MALIVKTSTYREVGEVAYKNSAISVNKASASYVSGGMGSVGGGGSSSIAWLTPGAERVGSYQNGKLKANSLLLFDNSIGQLTVGHSTLGLILKDSSTDTIKRYNDIEIKSVAGKVIIDADDVSINGNIYISGTINGGNFGNDVSILNNLWVGNDTSILNDLWVGNDVSILNNLWVGGSTNINGTLTVEDINAINANVALYLTVGADVSIGNDLYVAGDTNIDGDVTIHGDTSIYGDDVYFNNTNTYFNEEVNFNNVVNYGDEVTYNQEVTYNDIATFNSSTYFETIVANDVSVYHLHATDVSYINLTIIDTSTEDWTVLHDASIGNDLYVEGDIFLNGNALGFNLSDLGDVNINNLDPEDVLSYSGTKWVNQETIDMSGVFQPSTEYRTVTPTSSGKQGDLAFDASYFYVCTSTNKWIRILGGTTW